MKEADDVLNAISTAPGYDERRNRCRTAFNIQNDYFEDIHVRTNRGAGSRSS